MSGVHNSASSGKRLSEGMIPMMVAGDFIHADGLAENIRVLAISLPAKRGATA